MFENFKNIPRKILPVKNSTNGYWKDILLLHSLHLPSWNTKENIGISSNHFNPSLQEKHFDLPNSSTPVLYLNETTFKKLPIIVPKIK